ncbi:MAG: hypothetical protein M1831_005832 [Alyxoria varia]|nr:MAG: hypothetical protein M1831_005832 [Alyxoria varia]
MSTDNAGLGRRTKSKRAAYHIATADGSPTAVADSTKLLKLLIAMGRRPADNTPPAEVGDEIAEYLKPSQGAVTGGEKCFRRNATLLLNTYAIFDRILLLPTTEFLLTHRELETQTTWDDLVQSEEVLASHVIRVSGVPASTSPKDAPNLRDSKGKAKQFPTFNGKTVVIKDNFVYSNKGFKTLNQAQLLQDVLLYPDTPNAQQWLIYYISKPLVGTPEPLNKSLRTVPPDDQSANFATSSQPRKKDIQSFHDVLSRFPIISRQMQPGLEQHFQKFRTDAESDFVNRLVNPQEASPKPERPSYPRSLGSVSSISSLDQSQSRKSSLRFDDPQEAKLRDALEGLVIESIRLFQNVDRHQLSLLGSSTDLSGPAVEHMIERYVTECFHHNILFPKVCSMQSAEDTQLEADIRQMIDIDFIQVGIDIQHGQQQRKELSARIASGVESFKKMKTAQSPQEMIEILIATQKTIMSNSLHAEPLKETGSQSGKGESLVLANADLLVSLLLIVIIRSQIGSLHARLLYMTQFSILNDVESGETGYSISTFEAVLSYILHHSSVLKKASQANRALWRAIRKGDMSTLARIMEQDSALSEDSFNPDADWMSINSNHGVASSASATSLPNGHAAISSPRRDSFHAAPSNASGLGHVFPFANQDENRSENKTKVKKKVSMDVRSMSSSSEQSHVSRTSTLLSSMSFGHEISVERLSCTQDHSGNSVLMMGVEASQEQALKYLLQMGHLFPIEMILDDYNNEKTTLLSAAVQSGNKSTTQSLVDCIQNRLNDRSTLRRYLAFQDVKGRAMAHYLFNAPELISSLALDLPWQLKDKNGQTPLFALCRSYDHEDYSRMVETALSVALQSQGDGEALHLDLHTDIKSNTLLHVVTNPRITKRLLQYCDSDPNAKNEKNFTPLMVASKFARIDSVRIFFIDDRTDLQARDQRGFTAVELAKDDEVRNRIDDMVLLSTRAATDGRITTIVRSFFIEDGTIRLVLKSGAPNPNSTITVTTCRRSVVEFEKLAHWLMMEHPASWLPSISNLRSPCQLLSKPSRAVLRDIQIRLDLFLQTLLSHPTFSTHEMLWEFFLVPDIDLRMLAERAHLKASTRVDNLREDYEPLLLDSAPSVERFVSHASDQVRNVQRALSTLFQHLNAYRNVSSDLVEAQSHCHHHMSILSTLPPDHLKAFERYSSTLSDNPDSSPLARFQYTTQCALNNTSALLTALARPSTLINSLTSTSEQLTKHTASASRSQRWPSALGLLDDTRARLLQESLEKANAARSEIDMLGRELNYTQQTVAGELAGWQESHAKQVREGLRDWAKGMVVKEKGRLEAMKRTGRPIGVPKPKEKGSEDLKGLDPDTESEMNGTSTSK